MCVGITALSGGSLEGLGNDLAGLRILVLLSACKGYQSFQELENDMGLKFVRVDKTVSASGHTHAYLNFNRLNVETLFKVLK